VIPCGITAYPPHPKLDKTALGTVDYVPWEYYEDISQALQDLRNQEIEIIALETTDISVPYHDIEFPFPVGLVLGNEALGVSRDVLETADRIIEIPVQGVKNSLNVGIAFGIVVYEIVRQYEQRASS
jgi:tRNA G18 (ribose-2'-O)-methylase SpoU